MATYVFETITVAQAVAFDRVNDTLIFSNPATTGAGLRVNASVPAVASTPLLSVLSVATGQTVIFGAGLAGAQHTVLPDGSAFAIGIPGVGSYTGGPKGDGLCGSGANDVLDGAGGDDVLGGGDGADTLTGGAGADLFIVLYGDSPASALPTNSDVILDWSAEDRLSFIGAPGGPTNYMEGSAASYGAALNLASGAIAGGVVDYVAVQVGGDVLVFADSRGDNGVADDVVTLRGRTLASIDASNIVANVVPAAPPTPAPPGTGAVVTVSGNLDAVHISHLLGADIDLATSTHLVLNGVLGAADVVGIDFGYDANAQLTSGGVTKLSFQDFGSPQGVVSATLTGLSIFAGAFGPWIATDDTQGAFATLFAGRDVIFGSYGVDLLRGYEGDDALSGMGGHDTIWGGNGNDTISAVLPPGAPDTGQGHTYLRGEAGDDVIFGGDGFDDTHGNIGNDTVHGGGFDDWVVGGQGNDMLFGDDGGDLCYGNLGADTIDGGAGADGVVGGQGNDVLNGGAGNDFIITGDRGDDTVTGGAGADTFRTFNQTGLDRVTDFNYAEGDRVSVDVGSAYTLSQVGADTVIDMGGGNQMILVGVTLSSLPAGWITGG